MPRVRKKWRASDLGGVLQETNLRHSMHKAIRTHWVCGHLVDSEVGSGQEVKEDNDDSAGRTKGGVYNSGQQPTNLVLNCVKCLLETL